MEQIKNIMPSAMSAQPSNLSAEEKCKQRCDMWNSTKGNLHEADGYNCSLCDNRGGHYEPLQQGGYWYEVMKPCKCDNIRRALRRLNKSGLKNIVDKKFENYETTEEWQKKIKAAAIDYCANGKGKWLFIGGQSGSGKTHLCTAAAIKLLKQGYNTKYMLWRDEVVALKSAVNDSEVYNSLIAPIKDADVLYIDDLFKTGKGNDGTYQQPTGADINLAFEIINYRSVNKKPYTIISSECTIAQLLSIDEAVGGRIAEMSVQNGYGFSINPDTKKNYRLKGVCEL